jgi:hypothetical protein
MREAMGLSSLRAPQWVILFGAVLYASIYLGVLDLQGAAAWLGNRPEVVRAFSDPNFGRADALILLFSTLFLGPLALFVALMVLVFVLAVFGGFMLPIVRWFRMPDWIASASVLSGLAALAWLYSDAWLPRSLWFLGLLARACRIVVSV